MYFDQDLIKELSVYAVQQFISNQIPLDESIAEKARSLELNEDQVKRVVESTNVIAFLKLREGSEDKTFEFKVASFPGVMDALLRSGTEKGYVDLPEDEGALDKEASFSVDAYIPEDQKHQALAKALYHIRGEMEKVAQEHYNCVTSLEKSIPELVKQANWQERLQTVTTPEEFSKLMGVFGDSGFEKAASLRDLVFVGKELQLARQTVGLIKEAGELLSRKKELAEMEKKAIAALARFAVGAVTHPLRTAASAVTAPVGFAAGVLGRTAKKTGGTIKRSKAGVLGASGMALSSMTYTPAINPRTGRPNDVWDNIYNS